jgi:hypothetical protein
MRHQIPEVVKHVFPYYKRPAALAQMQLDMNKIANKDTNAKRQGIDRNN